MYNTLMQDAANHLIRLRAAKGNALSRWVSLLPKVTVKAFWDWARAADPTNFPRFTDVWKEDFLTTLMTLVGAGRWAGVWEGGEGRGGEGRGTLSHRQPTPVARRPGRADQVSRRSGLSSPPQSKRS